MARFVTVAKTCFIPTKGGWNGLPKLSGIGEARLLTSARPHLKKLLLDCATNYYATLAPGPCGAELTTRIQRSAAARCSEVAMLS